MMEDWTKPDEKGLIYAPDELDPLINKISMQIGFLIHSDKVRGQTIADIAFIAQTFFRKNIHLLFNEMEEGEICRLFLMHPNQEAVKVACCHNLGDAEKEETYFQQFDYYKKEVELMITQRNKLIDEIRNLIAKKKRINDKL